MKLKFWNKDEPDLIFGSSYFVNGGDYEDQILVFVKQKDDSYGFLTIPLQENLWVPKEKFDFAIKEHIIDFIENLPRHVTEVTEAKFRENVILGKKL